MAIDEAFIADIKKEIDVAAAMALQASERFVNASKRLEDAMSKKTSQSSALNTDQLAEVLGSRIKRINVVKHG